MKNKKLKLDELKVKSFTTTMNSQGENTVKGGVYTGGWYVSEDAGGTGCNTIVGHGFYDLETGFHWDRY